MRFTPVLGILIGAGLLSWFVFSTNGPDDPHRVKLGLDLAGGTELGYLLKNIVVSIEEK